MVFSDPVFIADFLPIALKHVLKRRNRIDEPALAVTSGHQPHRIVLPGDSIIRDMTLRYAVGSQNKGLNMTTRQDVGLPGDVFLLTRHLQSPPAPNAVVIAAASDDFDVMPDPRMVHYYTWSTFTQPAEQAFLKKYMPSIDARDDDPAAMDPQERIPERLIGLVRRAPARFPALPPPLNPNAPVEPVTDNQASAEATSMRVASRDLLLAPMFRVSVARMCELSQEYGFTLDLVWAPMPPSLLRGDEESGHLAALEAQPRDVLTEYGTP